MNKFRDGMRIRTVTELQAYLDARALSAEEFAPQIKVSNMTVRRLLRRPSSYQIPEKYRLLIDMHFLRNAGGKTLLPAVPITDSQDLKAFFKDLEKAGAGQSNFKRTKMQALKKLSENKSALFCGSLVKSLAKVAAKPGMPVALRSLAVGALVYFVNPFDFIPDAMLSIGYLDDFAVLSLVREFILEWNMTHA